MQDDIFAELDAMIADQKKLEKPKDKELPRAFRPTKRDTREFLKTKKRNKEAQRSRSAQSKKIGRKNRGKRGGKRR